MDKEETHAVNSYTDPKTKETRKKIVVGFIGIKKPVLLNETSKKAFEKWWGTETSKWVGNKARAKKVTFMISGKEQAGLLWEPVSGQEKQKR